MGMNENKALDQSSGDQFLQPAIFHGSALCPIGHRSSEKNCGKLAVKTQTLKKHLSSSKWRSDLFYLLIFIHFLFILHNYLSPS